MNRQKASAILFLALGPCLLQGLAPKEETLRAWSEYIDRPNLSLADCSAASGPLVWTGGSSETWQRVQRGEIEITNRDARKVPQGLIHHWTGTLFVENATLDQAISVLNGYERYPQIYKPLFRRVDVLERNGETEKLNVVATQKAFGVIGAVETEEDLHRSMPNPNTLCIRADSVRVQEIADYGQPSEHVFPEAKRPGFVWRALIVERLEQKNGGVYIELQTVSLSRGIPVEFRWLVKPLTDELPRKMLLDMLTETKIAIQQEPVQLPKVGVGASAPTRAG